MWQKLRPSVRELASCIANSKLPRELAEEEVLRVIEFAFTQLLPGRRGEFEASHWKCFQFSSGAVFKDHVSDKNASGLEHAQDFADAHFIAPRDAHAIVH